ncbi:SNF2 family N-terminal domain-containing protein [Sparassis latifolia]
MASPLSTSSPTTLPPIRSFAQSDPIDLTQDDDDEDEDGTSSYVNDRKCKRMCTSSRSFDASCSTPSLLDASSCSKPYHSGLSPAMSSSSLHPGSAGPSASSSAQWGPPRSTPDYTHAIANTIRPPPFTGPSTSSAFFQPRPSTTPLPPVLAPLPARVYSETPSNSSARHVIDLTSSPSPPPGAPLPPIPQPTLGNLPPDLGVKTPVCIGQLTVTALVLYPIPYLEPQPPVLPDSEWAPVRLSYEHNPNKVSGQETIHIKTPSMKTHTGEILPGENFGVVEQKIATHLGPMYGRGLIRLDAKVRRGIKLPILPLQLLVFTPKGNIQVVADWLHRHGLFLDHPTLSSDKARLANQYYYNPHNPPPGGHARALIGPSGRLGYLGPGGSSVGRWNAGSVSGKSVEVQRSQVDELFKSLRDGEELEETEPAPDVATKLYPHQKKALTFLLERERERVGPSGTFSSLWQERQDPMSGQPVWFHIVTQRETRHEPQEAKGAILADDMGLGKTITCVSLIAATVESAHEFSASPLCTLPPRPPPQPESSLSAAHFAGSVWGMPDLLPESSSKRSKAKVAREQDRREAEYMRASRIKVKSRATLVICPLSTVVNWEDQFREHWRGEVTIVGGNCTAVATPQSGMISTPTGSTPQLSRHDSFQLDIKSFMGRVREGTPVRIYVYHGNARRPDATFLADFDVVITTYSTLASEFSKQMRSIASADDDDDDDGSSDGNLDLDDVKPPKSKKAGAKKRKKPCTALNGVEATSPLQSVHWFRVVLDEAHSIKETSTVACRACCDLIADRRLCLTGTPVQNKLDDVFALIKFLRLSPLDDKNVWTEFIGTPVKYGQPLGVARIQTIMKCITLRRTKESKADDGGRILSLPPRRDELRYLKFDEQEQAIYDQFFQESKEEFHELSHKNEVMKNYVGILQKILRLRQICDHFELVKDKGLGLIGDTQTQDSGASYEDIVAVVAREGINVQRAATIFALLRESSLTQCVECGYELAAQLDVMAGEGSVAESDTPSATPKRGRKAKAPASRSSTRQNSPSTPTPHAVLTRCQHLFCLECFRNSVYPGWPNVSADLRRCCATCQTALSPLDAVEVGCDQADMICKKKSARREKRTKGISLENFHPSTKVKALMSDLVQFSKYNPYSANYDPSSIEVQMVDDRGNNLDDGVVKTVVFSQWTTMLDKVEDALEVAGIRYDRLDGTMKRDERTRAMEALKHDPGCEVLLVSLKAGGVGLNLTAAQRVYLMDPYWNPAVENQAVDRIHRLGQTRPVTTVKLIIENSIEARLLEVQRKKTELANMTLGQNFTKAEMLQRRMEELNQLFGG